MEIQLRNYPILLKLKRHTQILPKINVYFHPTIIFQRCTLRVLLSFIHLSLFTITKITTTAKALHKTNQNQEDFHNSLPIKSFSRVKAHVSNKSTWLHDTTYTVYICTSFTAGYELQYENKNRLI